MRAVISLGSNLGESAKTVTEAAALIKAQAFTSDFKLSGLYLTKPVGYSDQPDFVNAAASFECGLEPAPLLDFLLSLEQKFLRKRLFKNGPRTLDLDLICFGSLTLETESLILPHPRMHGRAFVLVPAAEIEPDFTVPGFGSTISELLLKLPREELNGVRAYG